MSDKDGDNIFEGTLTKVTGQNGIKFKFVNHHDRYELKDQKNRNIPFAYRPEIIIYDATFNDPKGKIIIDDNAKEY